MVGYRSCNRFDRLDECSSHSIDLSLQERTTGDYDTGEQFFLAAGSLVCLTTPRLHFGFPTTRDGTVFFV